MNKKRNKLEIIRDILQVISARNNKIKPTHILYKSNLSYQMMDDYLKELIEKGFILKHRLKSGKTYSITEKGVNYIKQYSMILDFTESFGLE